GGFEGSFHANIVDENSRINVQALDNVGTAPAAVFTQLRAMMADPKYDFIFDEEDANRDRVRRDDVILAMKDWVDIDETATALAPDHPPGDPDPEDVLLLRDVGAGLRRHPAGERNPAAAGDRSAPGGKRHEPVRIHQRHLPHHRHRTGGPDREAGYRRRPI